MGSHEIISLSGCWETIVHLTEFLNFDTGVYDGPKILAALMT